MTRLKTLMAALAASTLMAGVAIAADQAAAPTPQRQAETDAGKLSTDGIAAYRDLHLARLAIYEAKPDQARMFVSHAQSALDKAKTDASAFTKAEADLKPPAGMTTAATLANGSAADPAKEAGKAPPKTGAADAKQPVTWLPVDAQLVLADDFVARTPDQTKAVDEANQHLKAGDRNGAVERLKLAGIDVDFTMAVVPLNKTVQEVDQAAKLIKDGRYYEANAALKTVEDGVRFDVIDATAVPKTADAGKAGAETGKTETGKPSPARTEATGSTAKPKTP